MAFSNDKGRHRRGRWWRRGSYLFSRRSEAPPDADRSFWAYGGPSRRPAEHAEPKVPRESAREAESRSLRSRLERDRQTRPERDRDAREPHRAQPGRAEQARPWELRRRWEGGERLPAAVVERPQYTWYDFELDDLPPRAQPNRPDAPSLSDGLRHCGRLEAVLHRQWDARLGPPPPDVVRAVESLARLPERLKDLLADGLEGIYVGPGGVPDLDDMGYLRGAPLPSGRATWDICAGAYGDRKIVVGDRPSPTPDVMMHEVGHAIDDIDSTYGDWVSDSPEFVALYEKAMPLLASAFHRQGGGLGRKEFFADAFAAIASRQRPALVDMLNGDTRMALDVMLFFNRRYGI
ncbi:hypothetical protein GCM10010149_42500 [Nonomuraea roseoviolacea subsp. roseoviolacea]|uniref:Lysine-specific metallo-endopeptidase domain-containing protein n=1 Tax=Nonomuraea roseoviolacea subsp. carminata TaxID=160689 RepID=A0ABT1JYH6_9ACTN|nr:hypothetical protein [Nonomuraea roseoviolacea]MCP2346798.1 hypothetical protein [Nonomuraea roseoviolacea subsp. carminata]